MVVLDRETFHAANATIRDHGQEASHYAVVKAHELAERGEAEAAFRWHSVWLAIGEVQRNRRREGELLN